MQLELTDPDGTKAEFMEFLPVKKPCCTPYIGPQQTAPSTW
jgi:hypothetical protein